MIIDVPTHKNFQDHALTLLNAAWDIIIDKYPDALKCEDNDEAYELDSPIFVASCLAQQGAELVFKSKIVEVAPLSVIRQRDRTKWEHDPNNKSFSELFTINASDLIDTYSSLYSGNPVPSKIITNFEKFRSDRNAFFHSVDSSLEVSFVNIMEYILELAHWIRPNEWIDIRRDYYEKNIYSKAGGSSTECQLEFLWEMNTMTKLLGSKALEKFFGFNDDKYVFVCPRCLDECLRLDNPDEYFSDGNRSTAQLSEDGSLIYCFVCGKTTEIEHGECEGFCSEDSIFYNGMCLRCTLER